VDWKVDAQLIFTCLNLSLKQLVLAILKDIAQSVTMLLLGFKGSTIYSTYKAHQKTNLIKKL